MRFARFQVAVIAVLMNTLVWAQQPSDSSSTTLAYENGSITNNVYTNECFGIAFVIPVGWEINTQLFGAEGKAKHAAGQLALLMLDQHKEGSFGNRIVVLARETGSVPTAEEFVSKSAQGQVDLDRERRQILKDTYPANYGGKIFFRADYRQAMSNGDTLYDAFVYTKFRGYYIGETISAGSPEGLELGASSLQGISFQDDKPDPKCVMSGDESPNAGGVIGGVLSSKPPQPKIAAPLRVRVSSGVAVGLLIKKVAPDYPDLAKQKGCSRAGHSASGDRRKWKRRASETDLR